MAVERAHRQWPTPKRPAVMRMRWHDLLFMHWPIDVALLRPHIPAALEIDSYQNQAWLGVVPFHMTNVRPRFVPPIPGLSAFAEINVRTYVMLDGKPGVWFFSLDAASHLAVLAARRIYLPYFDAAIRLEVAPGDRVRYVSDRTDKTSSPASFSGSYWPAGPVFNALHGSLDDFLTSRYCLYAADSERILRLEIDHPPWPLQVAMAEVSVNTMTAPLGFAVPQVDSLLHFAKVVDMVGWTPEWIRP